MQQPNVFGDCNVYIAIAKLHRATLSSSGMFNQYAVRTSV